MAFFLVDIEFRKKAKHLLTTKEIWFCIFFCIFALLPWMEIGIFAGNRLFGKNGTFLPDGFWDDNEHITDDSTIISEALDPTPSLNGDNTPTMESSCSPKFPKLCVPKTWVAENRQSNQSLSLVVPENAMNITYSADYVILKRWPSTWFPLFRVRGGSGGDISVW